MKKKHLILGFLLFAGSFSALYAQDDIKEWKSKLKQLTPEQYKQLVEENNTLQKQLSDSRTETDHFRSESEAKDAQISKLEKELSETKAGTSAIAATNTSQSATTTSNTATNQKVSTSGLVYKVQIGAFKNKDLQKYLSNHKNFSGDVDQDGTRKYTLGEFSDYWEADRFKKYLREMGVKDAWIVSYKDGKRVPIKDALEGVL